MFVINPPFTLKAQLKPVMPQLVELLGQDRGAGFTLDSAG
jgi:23S rRNA (adenine2030-N6)-methyltransferase